MLLLLLAACGYPTYYPKPPALLDTAPVGEPPCGSVWAYEAVELRARSAAGVPLSLYEVGEDCAETLLGALSTDQEVPISSFPGKVYVARADDAEVYAWVQVPYGEPVFLWEIR